MKKFYIGKDIAAQVNESNDLILQLEVAGITEIQLTLKYNEAMELAFYIKENLPTEEE